jgi:hypothetical protein
VQIFNRVSYRTWQLWRAIIARPLSPTEEAEIAEILQPAEIELFCSQDLTGQNHSYRVMKKLRDAGYEDRDLLSATLLHDIGKYQVRPGWWDRPVVVLAQALIPNQASNWSKAKLNRWNRPFVVNFNHAEWGATAAEKIGSSEGTIALIRRHQEPILKPVNEEERLLSLLQWADDIN